MLRAFALYFQLANIAEQHHRLRRRREYLRERRTPRESLAEAFELLAGVDEEELARRARHVSLELVLTAHPTEATRRTILAAHVRLGAALAELDDPELPEPRRHELEAALAREVTGLWQTDEVRGRRPRVGDEIRNGLWFFEQSLLDVAPRLLADYRERLPDAPVPLRFGSWIGGDRDGNPATSEQTVEEALDRARSLALGRYREEVRALAVELGVSETLATRHRRAGRLDRARRSRALGVRREHRGAERGRAVPAQALVRLVAARQRRLRVAPKRSQRTST